MAGCCESGDELSIFHIMRRISYLAQEELILKKDSVTRS